MPPVAGTAAQIPAETTPAPEQRPAPTTAPATVATPPPEPETISTPPPIPPTTTAPPAEASPLTVLSIVGGEVLVKAAGTDSWVQAAAGTTLQPGDTIKTGGSSKAELTFFEGSTVELEASTEVLVSELGIAGTGSTTISLKQQLGKTISRVKKLTDTDSRFEIETPAAVAAVRGSTMVVTVLESGKTEVGNLGGDIRIIVDNVEYIIHEGMKRTIIPGQPPGPEVSMYPQGGGGGGAPTPSPRSRLEVTMLAEPTRAHIGDNITYTCRLHNTGELSFHDISVSTDISGAAIYRSGDLNGNSVLDPGENWVFTSVYTLREGDPSPLVATATISATTSTFIIVVETETASTSTLPNPDIALEKAASVSRAHVGDNITYTYRVTNTGDTRLLGVSVDDNLLESIAFTGGDDNEDGLLDIEEIWVFSANYTVSAGDPDVLENTAIASGTDNFSQEVAASANASVAILRPVIALEKSAGVSQAHVGDNITYTYTVTNTGNTPLGEVSVFDDRLGSFFFTSEDGRLDTNEIWAFSANYTVGIEDPDWLENIATASGTDNLSKTVDALASASVAVLRPSIALNKSAGVSRAHVGDNVTYTYTVANTGNTPLGEVSVDDNLLVNIAFTGGDDNEDGLLDIEEIWVFSANYTVGIEDPDLLENIATASGTDNLSKTVNALASASVAVLRPDITLEKSAPSEVRRYCSVTYTYTVTNTGNTPLVDVSVVDDRLGSFFFTSDNGQLDVQETWVFYASYIVGSGDNSPLINTAIASGTDDLGWTVEASDEATVIIKDT